MDETWTLSELVAEAKARLEALPAPTNGQIRAVPDERTVRYYTSIGLLDRPFAMRGRTALYAARHLAQVVAIKRMQSAGRSLADIQQLWPTLDDPTLSRVSGVHVPPKPRTSRSEFWKREVKPAEQPPMAPAKPAIAPTTATSVQIELAGQAALVLALSDDTSLSLTPADVRALRAAAAPLVAELAKRGLIAHVLGTLEEEP